MNSYLLPIMSRSAAATHTGVLFLDETIGAHAAEAAVAMRSLIPIRVSVRLFVKGSLRQTGPGVQIAVPVHPLKLVTAHQGVLPYAWLDEVPNQAAAARTPIPNVSFAKAFTMTISPWFVCVSPNKRRDGKLCPDSLGDFFRHGQSGSERQP